MTYYKVYGISDCPACLHTCGDLMSCYPQVEFAFINTDFSRTYREELKDRYDFSTLPIIVQVKAGKDFLIGGHAELNIHLAEFHPTLKS